ncbi:hypothetical protein ABPG74_016887 [Tetrahymena malaccensis]
MKNNSRSKSPINGGGSTYSQGSVQKKSQQQQPSVQQQQDSSYSIQISVRMRPLLQDFEDEVSWIVDKQNKSIQSQTQKNLAQSQNNANSNLLAESASLTPINGQQGKGKLMTMSTMSQDQLAIMRRRYADAYYNYSFNFDQVYSPQESTESIYNSSCKNIVYSVLDGYNSTIFMYGQTTSGKTFTMLGDMDNPGVLPYSLHDIFDEMEKRKKEQEVEYQVLVSYIEIYNEQINDLINPGMTNLRIHDDPKIGPIVQGMKQCEVTNFNEAIILMRFGEEHRCYKEKNIHEHSSRSHTIFQLKVLSKSKKENNQYSTKAAVLNLVDLAGSERLHEEDSKSGNNEETGFINKSLFVLSNVINKLAEGKSNKYIPFRDSKLTRFLSNALGGNSMTAIICTISPAAMNFYQTLSTLRFATRAKKVYTTPVVNEIKHPRDIGEINKEIDELNQRLIAKNTEIEMMQKDKIFLENTLVESTKQINLLNKEIKKIKSKQNLEDDYSLQYQQLLNDNNFIDILAQRVELFLWDDYNLSTNNSRDEGYSDLEDEKVNKKNKQIDEDAVNIGSKLKDNFKENFEQCHAEWSKMQQKLVNRYKQDVQNLQLKYKDEIKNMSRFYMKDTKQNEKELEDIIQNRDELKMIKTLERQIEKKIDNNTIFNGIAVNIILDPQLPIELDTAEEIEQYAVNVKAAYQEASQSLEQKFKDYKSLLSNICKTQIKYFATSSSNHHNLNNKNYVNDNNKLSSSIQKLTSRHSEMLQKLTILFSNKSSILESVYQQVCQNLDINPGQIFLPTTRSVTSTSQFSNITDNRVPFADQSSIANILKQNYSKYPPSYAAVNSIQGDKQMINNTPKFEEFLSNKRQNTNKQITDFLDLEEFSSISERENHQVHQKNRSMEYNRSYQHQNQSSVLSKKQQSTFDQLKSKPDGSIITFAWGSGKDGRLGLGTDRGESNPTMLANEQFIYLSCGYYHTAGITEKGELYLWGKGNSGQLGNSSFNSSKVPILANIPQTIPIVQVVCGWQHSMALSSSGQVYSWGLGEEGQLGHNDMETLNTPKMIEYFCQQAKQIKYISCGHSHSAAISEEGDLYTWGCNYDYRLMINENKNQYKPVLTQLHYLKEIYQKSGQDISQKFNVQLVSLGVNHTAVITVDGSVYTAGLGNHGELGIVLNESVPNTDIIRDIVCQQNSTNAEERCCYLHKVQTFGEENKAIDVACGYEFTIVLNSEGTVYQFGKKISQGPEFIGTKLEIQDYVTKDSQNVTPQIMYEFGNIRVQQIAAGKNHIAIITENGELYTWGKNFYDKLDMGDDKHENNKPVKLFEGINNLQCIQVSCGEFHSVCLNKFQKK